MKKELLLGMFLCGTIVSFAQKNVPIYTERIDSIISTGEANIVKKNYEYNEDGSCTMTALWYNVAKKLIAKQIVGYDKKGQQISVYTYNLDEENPNSFYTNYEYSYDDEGRKVLEKEYILNEEINVSEIDYSGVTGYPKVVVIKFFINGEDTGMEYRKFYNADDNEVLEEQGVQFNPGEWKISHKYVTEYENNVKKSYTHYRSNDDGKTFILDYQDLYANGKLKEHNEYSYDFLYNYKKYDNHGNIIEEYNHEPNNLLKHNYYKNTYDSEGRLTEKIKSQANEDHASERSTYVYKKTKSGIAYYVETIQYLDDKSNPYSTSYYVQSKVEDGIVKDYSCLYSSFYANSNNLWSNTSSDVTCYFNSKGVKDKAYETAIYRFNGEEPAFLRKHDNYKFTKEKDFAYYDLYRNPLLIENKGDNLTFIGTNKYVYDEKVLGSSIFLGEDTQYKILYEVLKDTNGKEIGRTTYYYSPYKATTTDITSVASSSDKAQSIYNLNGQKVTTTQAGQIYIQNGKKFIAK